MSATTPSDPAIGAVQTDGHRTVVTPEEAQRRQEAYAASRRAWAERVGRPYQDDPDLRPPPGELDAVADE